jgi:eukaryotic-like serine/threonine-protein kinase
VTTALDLDAAELGTLQLLGSGGQGRVFALPDRAPDVVYKEYSPRVVDDLDVDALYRFVSFARELEAPLQGALLERAAWPEVVVRRDGVVRGFLMRRVPEPYWTPLRFGGETTTELALAQFLLNPRAYLVDCGLPTDDAFRLAFLHDAVLALALFHKLGIAVGDMSPNNLLFSRDHQPHCFFLDCDAMRLNGESVLPQAETPDWQVGAVSAEELATPASDTYKLALLAIRLFAADQQTTDPTVLPPRLRRTAAASLSRDPDSRGPVLAWVRPLERQLKATPAGTSTGPPLVVEPELEPESEPYVIRLEPPGGAPAARRGFGLARLAGVAAVVLGLAFSCAQVDNSPRRPVSVPVGRTPVLNYPAGTLPGLPANPLFPIPKITPPLLTLSPPFNAPDLRLCPVPELARGVRGGDGLASAAVAVKDLTCALNRDDPVSGGASALSPRGVYESVRIVGFFGENTAGPRATVQLAESTGACVQTSIRFDASYRISSVAGRSACG